MVPFHGLIYNKTSSHAIKYALYLIHPLGWYLGLQRIQRELNALTTTVHQRSELIL